MLADFNRFPSGTQALAAYLPHVNTRGHASAHKTMLLAALAYHLKKLLKHWPQQQLVLAAALPKPPVPPSTGLYQRKTRGTV